MKQSLDLTLELVQKHVAVYFKENMPVKYCFHNYDHTLQVIKGIELIGAKEGVDQDDMKLLKIAAWFHDTGYSQGGVDHESRSAELASDFLKGKISTDQLEIIQGIIMATKMPQTPQNLLQMIICDADLSHLGNEHFWERNDLLKDEMEKNGIKMGKTEWLEFEIKFISNHTYHTKSASELYEANKSLFLKQLNYQLQKRESKNNDSNTKSAENADFDVKNISRSTETLFRTAYSNHLNLNSLADSKAHIMMGVNSIMFSVAGSNLIPKWNGDMRLVVPTIALLASCLLSVFYAILTIKPKLIKGSISLEEVKDKTADLLFFGNYTGMKLADYQWAMRQLIQDPQYIYDSMSKSIYFLGQVLNKKYRYLTYCYTVFLYGLFFSLILFAVCLLFISK